MRPSFVISFQGTKLNYPGIHSFRYVTLGEVVKVVLFDALPLVTGLSFVLQ